MRHWHKYKRRVPDACPYTSRRHIYHHYNRTWRHDHAGNRGTRGLHICCCSGNSRCLYHAAGPASTVPHTFAITEGINAIAFALTFHIRAFVGIPILIDGSTFPCGFPLTISPLNWPPSRVMQEPSEIFWAEASTDAIAKVKARKSTCSDRTIWYVVSYCISYSTVIVWLINLQNYGFFLK